MFGWAATFLLLAIVAAILGLTGIAGVATNIAWLLFLVGILFAALSAILGRRSARF